MKSRSMMLAVILMMQLSFISGASASEPDNDRMKADLIGKRIEKGMIFGWKFESLSEFVAFHVIKKNEQKYIIEYDVFMTLRGANSNKQAYVHALINYRQEGNQWQFASITVKNVDEDFTRFSQEVLLDAVFKHDIQIMEGFLNSGIDVNVRLTNRVVKTYIKNSKENFEGMTALIFAAGERDVDMVKLLLEHGADVNVQSRNGWTALSVAEMTKNTKIAQLLGEIGATLNKEQKEKQHEVRMSRTRHDMKMIDVALHSYHDDYQSFPIQFTDLTTNGYWAGSIKDDWGTPFVYWSDGKTYKLTSYGSDRKQGGNDKFEVDIILSNGNFIAP